jgi:hypothetical protein
MMPAAVTGAIAVSTSVGLVFLVAAGQKLGRPRDLARTIAQLGVPAAVSVPAAGAFIVVEACTGALLIANRTPQLAALLGLSVATWLFVLALYAGARGLQVECNCFGSSERSLGWSTLPLASMLVIGEAFYAAFAFGPQYPTVPLRAVPLVWASAVSLIAALLWLRTGRVVYLIRRQRLTIHELWETYAGLD